MGGLGRRPGGKGRKEENVPVGIPDSIEWDRVNSRRCRFGYKEFVGVGSHSSFSYVFFAFPLYFATKLVA